MFITKSGRLAAPLEELTHAYVATPASEASKKAQSKGRLVRTDAGAQEFPGQRGSAGRDGLLPGQGLLLLCTFPPSALAPWHSPGHCQPGKEVLGKWCVGACKIPIIIFSDFTRLQKDSQSLSLPASSFSFGLSLVLPPSPQHPEHAFCSSNSGHLLRPHRGWCTAICSPVLSLGLASQLIFLGLPAMPANLAGPHLAAYSCNGCWGEGRPGLLGHVPPPHPVLDLDPGA